MKVLLVAHAGDLTGASRDLLELADALERRGFDVEAVVPRRGPLAAALGERKIPAAVVPYRWWASARAVGPRLGAFLVQYPIALERARAHLRQTRPDVVVTFTLTVPVWAAAADRTGIPHIWMAREFGVEDHGLHFLFGRGRSMRFVDARSGLVGVPSRAVADRLAEWVAPAKLRVIRYAAEQAPSGAVAEPSDDFDLLIVGTMRESKGLHDAIEAVARLRGAGVPAHLTIVGSGRGGYARRLERLASTLGVRAAVTFAGSVPDATPFYDAADLLLLCSRCEAYGRVVIEAMKRGLPVVGTHAGGTVEQIGESDGGLLYEPGDIDQLVAAVTRLYEDGDLRKRLAAGGRAWATANFSLERFADEFAALAEEAQRTARAAEGR